MARSVAIAAVACTWACEAADLPQNPDCPAQPICEQNTLVRCGDAGVVRTPCGDARCASDAPVPACIPANALPCAADAPPLRCENGLIVDCAEDRLYYLARACGAGEFCIGEETPRCIAAEGVSCNPDFWTALCVEGQRFNCTPQGLIEVVEDDCASD